MNRDTLIKSLAQDLKPTEFNGNINFKTFQVLIAGMVSILTGIAIVGLRSDIFLQLNQPLFIAETILLFMLAIASTATAMRMSIPGLLSQKSKILVFGTFIAWSGFLIYYLSATYPPVFGWGFVCVLDILILSLVPAAMTFFFIQKAACLNIRKTAFYALFSSVAYAAIGTQFVCQNSQPIHTIIWHMLPMLVISLLGSLLAKWSLRKI